MFSNKQLKDMILPLLMEQFLLMLVGLADTMVVSYAGEAAVSGVSLVNSFNTIFINLFTALASGGAVVVSQYIGRRDMKMASESSSQLLMVATVFAVVISIPVLIWKVPLLKGLFGKVEPDVMEACKTYLRISVYSFPALGIYNAGTALYRSIGKTSVTMKISIVSNLINVAGNLIGVFVFRAGVAGVAYPSLIARTFSAVVITLLCFREKEVRYVGRWIFQWNRELLKKNAFYCNPQWSGKRDLSVCKSGTFQCGCAVWYLPDRGKRNFSEYLECGSTDQCDHGAGIYYCDRSVYGSWRYQAGGILFSEINESDSLYFSRLEYTDLSDNATAYKDLCSFPADRADDPLSGADP